MKVLCILDNLSIASGVSSIVMNLYRNMDLQRIQMDFLVCNKQEESFESEIKSLGGNVFYTGNFLNPAQILTATSKARNFFDEHGKEYDVAHLHSPTISMFTLKYAEKAGIPIRIVHSHSTMMSMSKVKNLINDYLIKQIKKYSNTYCACSTEAAHFLYGAEFCNTHHVELIHNAVECSKFSYVPQIGERMRKELDAEDCVVFSHISNYSPIKNHIFLLDVMERFLQSGKKVKFLFVGNGATRENFEKQVIDRGLSKLCIFVDKTSEVAKYLYASDAAILPSLKEGLPVTLVESQAAGLPFFTSDTVTREVKIGQGEFVALNSDKWYEKLSSFQPLSVEERMDSSQAFQSSVFNIKVEAGRVTEWYERLLAEVERK